ncbi:O-Glycosyl hydrolase [Flavobacterium gillisiae]|jgi:O-glycosyl hydrolase|uniref:O-Glycosyl hydrolase n=1 Tax=Flavobacterium gillisiae TaxID=150146 RepID=A0A1H4F7I0_9FLAO|nr:glycoside hydrolase [Flavobacterium gillisiae]SEA93305.1 O-Glycosyl hydrolase [Flavobacterium gillisiae]
MNLIKGTLTSLFFASLLIIACSSDVNLGPPPIASDVREIKIDLNQELQTMDGFGASDGWRAQFVGKNWPVEKRNAIADLLFSKEMDAAGNPKGIGLSMWRFYVGSGSMEQGASSNIYDEWRRTECFQNPNGTYDWSKQAGQRWFLKAAKSRGVEKLMAFTVSPPVQMTINGKAFSPQKNNMNIKPGLLPDYADFLVECIDNLQRNEGVTFDYLSPVNEPQWDWMAGSNGQNSQEGTPATNQEMYDFTKLLSDKLKAKSLNTEIVLGEAATINYLYENVNGENRDDQINSFFGPSSANNIAQFPNVKKVISGHSYFTVWPLNDMISYREKLSSKVKQIAGLKYWQTEYSILENPGIAEIPGGSGNKRDLGMKTALFVARTIHNDIAVANASSWQWWTALSRYDYKDGLVYLDDGASNGVSGPIPDYCKNDGFYRDSKLLWAFGNFSLFVRPGAIRLQIPNQNAASAATDVMLTAYKDVAKKKLIIVAVNYSDASRAYKLNLSGITLKNNVLTPYVTSEDSNLKKSANVNTTKFDIPARSIVTYVGEYN